MSDSEDRPPAGGLEDPEAEAAADATEMTEVMEAIVAAIVHESRKPGVAVSALRLAEHAFRTVVTERSALSEPDVDVAQEFGDLLAAQPDIFRAAVDAAQRELHQRTLRAEPSPDELASTLVEATAVIKFLRSRKNKHPITQLVILYLATKMAHAMLEHTDPEKYEENRCIVRAMENSVCPGRIDVVDLPDDQPLPMSKGGDA